jgi:hypothetical protein
VDRYQVTGSAPQGGNIVSTWHVLSGAGSDATSRTAMAAAIRAFLNAFASQYPSGMSWTFPSESATVDVATGQVTAWHSLTPPASISGSAGGSYAAGVGFRVDWLSTGIHLGRRVKGRTYVVPSVTYESNGTVTESIRSTALTAANTLVTALNTAGHDLVVYSAVARAAYPVQGAIVPDRVAWLRTRKS